MIATSPRFDAMRAAYWLMRATHSGSIVPMRATYLTYESSVYALWEQRIWHMRATYLTYKSNIFTISYLCDSYVIATAWHTSAAQRALTASHYRHQLVSQRHRRVIITQVLWNSYNHVLLRKWGVRLIRVCYLLHRVWLRKLHWFDRRGVVAPWTSELH